MIKFEPSISVLVVAYLLSNVLWKYFTGLATYHI